MTCIWYEENICIVPATVSVIIIISFLLLLCCKCAKSLTYEEENLTLRHLKCNFHGQIEEEGELITDYCI